MLVGSHRQLPPGGMATLHNPFASAASLVQGGEAVAASEPPTTDKGGVVQQVDSYWVAHRVG